MATAAQTDTKIELYRDLARQLRLDSIRCSTAAGSGHPTSSLSAADLIAVLLAGHLRYDFGQPDNPANDHLIFSKGHASPLVYAMFKAAGAINDDELMTFRKFGSRLEGHPTPILPWVDVATGSLGQGLPIGVGVALAGKRVLEAPYHVWVLVGDSETAEGSIWEAFDHAGHEGLANLTAIVDVNRLGQRGPTELEWDMGAYAARVRAFGVDPIVIDGHDLAEIEDAYARARAASLGIAPRDWVTDASSDALRRARALANAAVNKEIPHWAPACARQVRYYGVRRYDFVIKGRFTKHVRRRERGVESMRTEAAASHDATVAYVFLPQQEPIGVREPVVQCSCRPAAAYARWEGSFDRVRIPTGTPTAFRAAHTRPRC